jgi:hypothetical protein
VEVTRIVDHQFIHSIYFNDPNGISLEASVWLIDPDKEVAYADKNPVPAVNEKPIPGPAAQPRPLSPEVRERAVAAGLARPDWRSRSARPQSDGDRQPARVDHSQSGTPYPSSAPL